MRVVRGAAWAPDVRGAPEELPRLLIVVDLLLGGPACVRRTRVEADDWTEAWDVVLL